MEQELTQLCHPNLVTLSDLLNAIEKKSEDGTATLTFFEQSALNCLELTKTQSVYVDYFWGHPTFGKPDLERLLVAVGKIALSADLTYSERELLGPLGLDDRQIEFIRSLEQS
jgi:hypothetical protein